MSDAVLPFVSYGVSHRGCVRQRNEDSYLIEPESGLWLVADGMGGHDAGDVASASIVENLARIGVAPSAPELRARFEAGLVRAHEEIRVSRGRTRGDDRLDGRGPACHGRQLCLLLVRRQPRLSRQGRGDLADFARSHGSAGTARQGAHQPCRGEQHGRGATSSRAPSASATKSSSTSSRAKRAPAMSSSSAPTG